MPPVLAALFWIWVVVSIVVLVRRRIAKRAEREVLEAAEAAEAADTAASTDVVDTEETEVREAPVAEPVAAMATAPAPVPAAPLPPPVDPIPEAVLERPIRTVPAAGVADALVGIRMPCDLVPLVLDRLATDRITLSTVGHPAEEVGTALADEVERLGYVVRPLSDREVIATRGATELRLTITPPDFDGRHLHHPQAREDSVVVEIVLS
jgi:hypothetical protein